MWGFPDVSVNGSFAMRYASLMLGWTILLFWAYKRPIERRFVAVLTMLVIGGLLLTEVIAVRSGTLEAWRMIPTWCLQALLIALFARALHHYRSVRSISDSTVRRVNSRVPGSRR